MRCVEEAGIGFCLAPRYHPAFRFAAPSRREIGIPTVFNLLGPMANPGRVRRQLIGVANPAVAERMLASLRLHGSHRAWVVHGNGLDELTTTGPSTVLALDDDTVRTLHGRPGRRSGLAPAIPDELVGGTPDVNAECVRRVMAGEHGAHRNIVVLNAAAALVVAGVADSLEAGSASLAMQSIDSGAARRHAGRASSRSRRRPPRSSVTDDRPGAGLVGEPGPGLRRAGHGALAARRGRRRPIDDSAPEGAQPVDEHHPATVAFRAHGGEGALWVRSPIPVGRGMGFSGAVRVGGLVAAHAQRHGDDHRRAAARRCPSCCALATELEGHADNVAASLYGGVVATAGGQAVRVPLSFDPAMVMWVPSFATSTDESRTKLRDRRAIRPTPCSTSGAPRCWSPRWPPATWTCCATATQDRCTKTCGWRPRGRRGWRWRRRSTLARGRRGSAAPGPRWPRCVRSTRPKRCRRAARPTATPRSCASTTPAR